MKKFNKQDCTWTDIGLSDKFMLGSRVNNEYLTYNEAVNRYGNHLPTVDEIRMLAENTDLTCFPDKKEFLLIGRKGQRHNIQATGYKTQWTNIIKEKDKAIFWCRQDQNDKSNRNAFIINNGKIPLSIEHMHESLKCAVLPVCHPEIIVIPKPMKKDPNAKLPTDFTKDDLEYAWMELVDTYRIEYHNFHDKLNMARTYIRQKENELSIFFLFDKHEDREYFENKQEEAQKRLRDITNIDETVPITIKAVGEHEFYLEMQRDGIKPKENKQDTTKAIVTKGKKEREMAQERTIELEKKTASETKQETVKAEPETKEVNFDFKKLEEDAEEKKIEVPKVAEPEQPVQKKEYTFKDYLDTCIQICRDLRTPVTNPEEGKDELYKRCLGWIKPTGCIIKNEDGTIVWNEEIFVPTPRYVIGMLKYNDHDEYLRFNGPEYEKKFGTLENGNRSKEEKEEKIVPETENPPSRIKKFSKNWGKEREDANTPIFKNEILQNLKDIREGKNIRSKKMRGICETALSVLRKEGYLRYNGKERKWEYLYDGEITEDIIDDILEKARTIKRNEHSNNPRKSRKEEPELTKEEPVIPEEKQIVLTLDMISPIKLKEAFIKKGGYIEGNKVMFMPPKAAPKPVTYEEL